MAMCCAASSVPLFFKYAVMPVARKVWLPILVLMPASNHLQASCCHMGLRVSSPVLLAAVSSRRAKSAIIF